jgi:hypothetical protein
MKVKLIPVIALVTGLLFLGSCSERLSMRTIPLEPNEVVLNRWSPDHVWTPGHESHEEGRTVWRKGHYRYAPRYRTTWSLSHYRKTPRGKVWIEERWK